MVLEGPDTKYMDEMWRYKDHLRFSRLAATFARSDISPILPESSV